MILANRLFFKFFKLFSKRNDERRDKGLQEPSGLTIFRNLRYAPDCGEDHLLDIYTPANTDENLPALISVHGGAFCYGNKELYRFYCMELALQGYTVINFNYRLLPNRFPAQLEDLNAVMQFICDHACEYHINPKQVFAVGDSAGATILSIYAAIASCSTYAEKYNFKLSPLRFCGIALHSGLYATDSVVFREWTKGVANVKEFFPLEAYITEDYPPTFFSYSVNDRIAKTTPAFASVLQRKGVCCDLHSYGETDRKISHVFHLDIRSKTAKDCNLRQKEFFDSCFDKNLL